MGAKRFRIYHDKNNKLVFLDDVIKDNNMDELDNNKLPEDARNGFEIRFKWDRELENYVMYTRPIAKLRET